MEIDGNTQMIMMEMMIMMENLRVYHVLVLRTVIGVLVLGAGSLVVLVNGGMMVGVIFIYLYFLFYFLCNSIIKS